jgi:Uncharacterized conserved protein
MNEFLNRQIPITDNLKKQWGWFTGLGIVFLLLGFIAAGNVVATTLLSMVFIGSLLIVGGIFQIIQAFRVNAERLWIGLIGAGYTLAGLFIAFSPAAAALGFTLFIGGALFVSGICRFILGLRLRPIRGWIWVIASAVLTLLLALVILFNWPITGLWAIGLFIAIDLIMQGVSMIFFGLTLRTLQ